MNNDRKHKVFVYGSIMRGFPLSERLPEDTEYRDAWTQGELYSLGAFPALYLRGEGKVQGEMIEVDDDTLHDLDRAEGHPGLYFRRQVECHVGEEKVIAWAYEFNRDISKFHGIPIPSGSWREHLKEEDK